MALADIAVQVDGVMRAAWLPLAWRLVLWAALFFGAAVIGAGITALTIRATDRARSLVFAARDLYRGRRRR